jgi:hypothetical protein
MRPTYSFPQIVVEAIADERYRHPDPRVQPRPPSPPPRCALLRRIARRGGLVPDNARYQRCRLVQSLAKELGIELLFLPSDSPNLNRIERLRKFVKKEVLNSRHHQDFQGSRAPSTGAWPNCRPNTERNWRPC